MFLARLSAFASGLGTLSLARADSLALAYFLEFLSNFSVDWGWEATWSNCISALVYESMVGLTALVAATRQSAKTVKRITIVLVWKTAFL